MRLAVPLCLLLTACASLPPRGQLAMRDVQFPVRDLRYASGLRILVEQDSRRPVVAIVTLVGSGGAGDPKGKEGLAHLVEHLTFRAHAEQRPSRWGQLEAAGAGRLNAYTSFDTTVYHEVAPRESLGDLLRLEGERLSQPLQGVSPETFAVEREVVRNELRERNETRFIGQVFSAIQHASFPGEHPYSRPIVGTHASLTALTLADAQAFTRAHYRPENTTMVIVGDVDPTTIDQLIAQHVPARLLGEGLLDITPDKRLPDEPPAVPLNPSTEIVELEAAVPSPELYLGWTLPRGYDDASYMHDFLEGVAPSVLSRAIREDGDIAGLASYVIPGRHASLFVVRVILNSGEHPEKSTERVLNQLQNLWDGQIASRNGLDYRMFVLTGLALQAEDVMSRAVSRAERTHFSLDARAFSRSLAATAKVDSTRISRFAYDYLRRERARVVRVRPLKGAAATASATGPVAPLSVDEDVRGQAPLTPMPSVSAFRTVRLDNGLEVVIGSTPGLPLATVHVRMHGGTATSEPLGVGLLGDALVSPDSFLQGHASDFGLHSRSTVDTDHTTFGFSGAAGNLPNMLAMTAEQLSWMETENDYVVSFQDLFLPYLEKFEASAESRATRAFRAALHPQHPYGRTALAADLRKLDKGDIDDWIARTYRPANAVVVIVGELDLDATEKQVRTWLSDWKGKAGAPLQVPPSEAGPARRVQFVRTHSPGATQASIFWGCPLPSADPAAEARYDVMADLVGKRLYQRVRAALGASYGMHGRGLIHEGGAAHLEVQGSVENAQVVPALLAVRQTLGELSRGEWKPVELEAARRRVNQEYALSMGTSSALASAVARLRGHGWALGELENYAQHLAAITPEVLQRDFQSCAEHLVVSLLGEEKVLQEAHAAWILAESTPAP
ncbi:M16 family metallopeptidase [Melittangium boletus]|uniref:M16 family metallopeptidase n=1 Tax=Melittangium boletus TaxID=83453 RepID=UPI003DA493F8